MTYHGIRRFLLCASIISLPLFSCANTQDIFKTDSRYRIEAGEIIFLPGLYTKAEFRLVEMITRKTDKIGILTVVPFSEYRDELNLGLAVEGGADTLDLKETNNTSRKIDKKKIERLFEIFDKPYICIFWIPQYYKEGSRDFTNQVTIIGRMYARDTGSTAIGVARYSLNSGCLLGNMISGTQAGYDADITPLLDQASDKFIQSMNEELKN